MASLNKVQLIGNAGRDPEVRYTAAGKAICNLTVATSSKWKDKESGEMKEETEWHRVVFYDRLAEVAGEYVKKGRSLYVEGRLKTRKWTDKDGVEKYTTEIQGDQMQLLGPKEEGAAKPAAKTTSAKPAAKTSTGFDGMDDDIPFMRLPSSEAYWG